MNAVSVINRILRNLRIIKVPQTLIDKSLIMSPQPTSEGRISTFIFRIPRISNLIIFKNVLEHKCTLVALVTEMLKLDHPEILYIGYDCTHSPRKDLVANESNAAIIRICIPGKELIGRDAQKTTALFIDELLKAGNIITVTTETLSREKDIIAVAITVEPIAHHNAVAAFSR